MPTDSSRIAIQGACLVWTLVWTSLGCRSPFVRPPTHADSTGTIIAKIPTDTFIHGNNPLAGSVVYLIEANPAGLAWWNRLDATSLPNPEEEGELHVVDQRIYAPRQGRMDPWFSGVHPGEYVVYARAFAVYELSLGRNSRAGCGEHESAWRPRRRHASP